MTAQSDYYEYSEEMYYSTTTLTSAPEQSTTASPNDGLIEAIPIAIFYGVYGPIFILGLFGNGMIVFIITLHKKMMTVPNLYILNLSVASMIIIIASAFRVILDNKDYVPDEVCATTQIVKRSSVFTTVYTLAALSIERFHAIRYPLKGHTGKTAAFVSKSVILFIWLFSFTITTIRVIKSGPMCTMTGTKIHLRGLEQMYFYAEFFLTYLIPLLITGTFYILTARELYLADRSTYCDQIHRLMEVKKKMVWVGLVLVIVYAVVYLPVYLMNLLIRIDFKYDWKLTVANIFYTMIILQPCLTPVILYSFSEPCRRHMKHYVCKWFFRSMAHSLHSENEGHRESVVKKDQPTTAV